MTVAILVVGALTFATITSLRNARLSQSQNIGTKIAQEGLEKTRTLRDRNTPGSVIYTKPKGEQTSAFSDLWQSDICSQTCYFTFNAQGTAIIGGTIISFETANMPDGFGRQIKIKDIEDGKEQKEVTAIVRWSDFSGEHESYLSTILRKI